MRADGAIAELWAKNDAGETPMMICCKNGSNECARELLKTKVPIQQGIDRNQTHLLTNLSLTSTASM